MKPLILSLLLCTLPLAAADVSGKWTGSYSVSQSQGDAMSGKVQLTLVQNGAELTGTVGPETHDQCPISKGTVEGDNIKFEAQTEGPLMKFELHLEDGHLRGEAIGDMEGNKLRVKLDLTRE